MPGETNLYYCLSCGKATQCNAADEKNEDYLKVRREQGICRDCYNKRKESNHASN